MVKIDVTNIHTWEAHPYRLGSIFQIYGFDFYSEGYVTYLEEFKQALYTLDLRHTNCTLYFKQFIFLALSLGESAVNFSLAHSIAQVQLFLVSRAP